VISHRHTIGVLVEDGFDDQELAAITEHLRAAGVDLVLIGPVASRTYTARDGSATVTSEIAPGAARDRALSALVIPGGYAADRLRMRHSMVDLVRASVEADRPVAAIGHGAQLLISARVVHHRTLTCWPSIAVDVKNAGALYVDRPAVQDGPVITARKLDDVPQFVAAILGSIGA
jgi:protease I